MRYEYALGSGSWMPILKPENEIVLNAVVHC